MLLSTVNCTFPLGGLISNPTSEGYTFVVTPGLNSNQVRMVPKVKIYKM